MPYSDVAGTPGAWAEVSPLGSEAFAVVVSPAEDTKYPGSHLVHAIYRLRLDGSAFERYGDGSSLGIIAGDLVPLYDGRLTAASKTKWMVSGPDGADFADVGLPDIGRIQRSGPYWVVYRLFLGGWPAISTDGMRWEKVHLN